MPFKTTGMFPETNLNFINDVLKNNHSKMNISETTIQGVLSEGILSRNLRSSSRWRRCLRRVEENGDSASGYAKIHRSKLFSGCVVSQHSPCHLKLRWLAHLILLAAETDRLFAYFPSRESLTVRIAGLCEVGEIVGHKI